MSGEPSPWQWLDSILLRYVNRTFDQAAGIACRNSIIAAVERREAEAAQRAARNAIELHESVLSAEVERLRAAVEAELHLIEVEPMSYRQLQAVDRLRALAATEPPAEVVP